MSVYPLFAICAALLLKHDSVLPAGPGFSIVTASETGTYAQIGKDLSKFVAQPAGISLRALPSNGSVENVKRLRDEPGTKVALVQADVYQAFLDQAGLGHAEAGRIIRPLRVIAPLFHEEIYFIARADSPLNYVHEVRDQRLNIGPIGSGTALTAATVYRRMFLAHLPSANISTLSHEQALLKLIKDKSIDVAVVVAGQPAPLLAGLEAGSQRQFKLLKLDPKAAATTRVLKTYSAAIVKAASYPNWLREDLLSLSVQTLLVTYDFRAEETRAMLVRLARSLCENFALLQSEGHPVWRQVSLTLPALSADWAYYPPTERALRSCRAWASGPKLAPTCPGQPTVP